MYKSNMTERLLCSESPFDHGERKIYVNCDNCSTTFLATWIMWYMLPSSYLEVGCWNSGGTTIVSSGSKVGKA